MSDSYSYLVGRVGTEPESKITPTGKTVSNFRLAVNGEYDPATKTRPTIWYDAESWEEMALMVGEKFGVGSFVYVAGPVSVYHGPTGDRPKIKIRECGLVEKLIPTASGGVNMWPAASKAKAKAATPEGFEDDDGEDW